MTGDDPFEIDETYASLFDDLDGSQYEALKASIRGHGVDTPVIIDAENKVIDGHHRLRAVRELRAEGYDIPDIPFVQKPARVDTLRARRANLARRDGHKKAGVQDYLREHLPEPPEAADTDADVMWPDDDDAWTYQGVAHELGVSFALVRDAIQDSVQICISTNLNIPSEREQKRDAVRSYIENNPDATDTEVANAVDYDVSRPTVNRWRNGWFDDDDDDDIEQTSIVGAGEDAETTSGIAQDAADGEETATETLQEGSATADSAKETHKQKENEKGGGKDDTVVDAATKQETDEWSSPRELVEPLDDAVGGFDLDPCSGAEQSPFADETYTEADDGLSQPWHGTVWVNPPYSEMAEWTPKAIEEHQRDDVDAIYYLCKGDSSTDWWQEAIDEASVVVAIDHRLNFGDGSNSAPFPSHIFVFGPAKREVLQELDQHGAVLSQLHPNGGQYQ
jgi:phage N-6-adenine-methyltransferase